MIQVQDLSRYCRCLAAVENAIFRIEQKESLGFCDPDRVDKASLMFFLEDGVAEPVSLHREARAVDRSQPAMTQPRCSLSRSRVRVLASAMVGAVFGSLAMIASGGRSCDRGMVGDLTARWMAVAGPDGLGCRGGRVAVTEVTDGRQRRAVQ